MQKCCAGLLRSHQTEQKKYIYFVHILLGVQAVTFTEATALWSGLWDQAKLQSHQIHPSSQESTRDFLYFSSFFPFFVFCFIFNTYSLGCFKTLANFELFRKTWFCPGWCGSVDWTWACEPKGHWFDSQSGHLPGLWARSPVWGTWEASTHWCLSLSLFPSLPLSLNINKENLKKKANLILTCFTSLKKLLNGGAEFSILYYMYKFSLKKFLPFF